MPSNMNLFSQEQALSSGKQALLSGFITLKQTGLISDAFFKGETQEILFIQCTSAFKQQLHAIIKAQPEGYKIFGITQVILNDGNSQTEINL
jgi:hypothetical protein